MASHSHLCDSHACPCYIEGQGRRGLRTSRIPTPVPCAEDMVYSPEKTPIENGVELHWLCCDLRMVLQKSTPWKLYRELIRHCHDEGRKSVSGE